MNTTHQPNDSSIIFHSEIPSAPKPLAPPEYRQQALRFIIKLNQSKGFSSLSMSELALQLRDPSLRGKMDPVFEPLSLESINAAVNDLVQARELRVAGRTVVFPAPSAPTA